MKLFYSPGACSLSPHIVCREAGLPLELVKVDLKAKKYDGGGDYLKINSKGYVPALQLESGQVLTEGPAIVQYLADQKPDARLAPKNGSFELINAGQILSVSVGVHPKVKEELAARMESVRKGFEGQTKHDK